MKEILYNPKNTTANTQYNEIDSNDMNYVLTEMIRYMALFSELNRSLEVDHQILVKDFWSSKDKHLPRSKQGFNSPETLCAGIINNIMFGEQNDLSDKQMEAITRITDQISKIAKEIKDLKRVQTTSRPLDKIIFKENLFRA